MLVLRFPPIPMVPIHMCQGCTQMNSIRLVLVAFLVMAMVSCSEQSGITVPDANRSETELSDVLPFRLMSMTEIYFDFGSALPNSVFFPLTGLTDWTVSGRDCCIRDDVVELYVNRCYIGTIDSRGGDFGTHEWVSFDLRLPPGDYEVEYRNVISSTGPSGWYARLEDAPFGSIEGALVPECFVGMIDIKPGSWPNSINRKANGVTPVAILGSEHFDVTGIDIGSLMFAGAMAPEHDLGDPDVYMGHLQDVNGDGYMDLVTHWRTRDLLLPDDATEACMLGDYFYACDAVRIVK